MSGPFVDNTDPDFTSFVLDQTDHIGSSGTLVSDFELCDASGFLQAQIDAIVPGGSGVDAGAVTEIVESGINAAFESIRLDGDARNANLVTFNGFPAVRFRQNANRFVSWNRRAPVGGTSGVTMQWAWCPNASQANNVKFRVTLAQLPSGVDTSAASSQSVDLIPTQPGGGWVQDIMYVHEVPISAPLSSLEHFNLMIERRGGDAGDAYTDRLFVLDFSIKHEV